MMIPKPKIMIVDRDFDSLDMLCCELYDAYDLYPISEGISSLAILEEIRPDLIIFSLDTSDHNDLFFYGKQQTDPSLKQIPVLLATTHAIEPTNKLYINKPYEATQIHSYIQHHLTNTPI